MLHQPPRVPAPHRVFHWIAVRLADPPDWVSPYFIRELRALLCRIPFGILLLILVCCGWFLAFRALVEPTFERRLQCLTAMQMVLGFYVAVLTPLMVLLGLQGGHDHERDLIRLVPRSGSALVMGKLLAAYAVDLLYLLAVFPFLATGCLLSGVTAVQSCGAICLLLMIGVVQANLAVFFAILCRGLASRTTWIIVLMAAGTGWTLCTMSQPPAQHPEFVLAGLVFFFPALLFFHAFATRAAIGFGPYLLPVPYEPDWARMVAAVARRFLAAICAIDEASRAAGEVDPGRSALREQAVRATAQRLTWVLNPGPNLWSGLGCRCALSPALKPLADEVAYAAQQVFERLGCLQPLLLRNLLDTPLWTETPPAIPRDEIARLQRAISQLQAWGDRELRRP